MAEDGGYVDDDVRGTLASGRATAGEMLVAVRSKLRRVFIVFVAVLLATIYAMRIWIWPILERDLLALGADVIVLTPFDVILLQAKIGIIAGILASIPFLLYYSREPLRRRGWWPDDYVPRWKLAAIGVMAVALFTGGITYSYNIFFPIMFDFLADNAISAGLDPTYSIVDWTEFILILALSFGVAAQLPLVMTALAYSGIVPYETFRDRWKHAVLGMFGFGAMFSPPDPFTMLMWAMPLLALYAFSLYLTRLVVSLKRGGSADLVGSLVSNANRIAAGFVLAAGLAAWLVTDGLVVVNRSVFPRIPAAYRPAPLTNEVLLPADGTLGVALVAIPVGLLAALLLSLYYLWPSASEDEGWVNPPGLLDIRELDADGVRAAPTKLFVEMDEEDAVELAGEAMDEDDPEKARAILDRYDALQPSKEGDGAEDEVDAPDDASVASETTGDRITRATANVMEAVRDEETTEDDIGGYYHDLAFIAASLRSKTFRIFAVFIGVLASVFTVLYMGGIGAIRNDFLRRLPGEVRPEEQVGIITLHPVEALVFMVKISTLLGVVSTIPLLLYYAWPALRERGIAGGDRDVFFGWAGAIFVGIAIGSAVGYRFVAPTVVAYFVNDALQANMIISYRVSNFFWLIFFTTVGIGLWFDIPVTMFLFHRGGIVTYASMREHWRVATLLVVVATAVLTPSSVLSMVLVTIPVMAAYALGLGLLWVYTLGGRRTPRATPRSG